jgi:DNA replication and repair protein RecF
VFLRRLTVSQFRNYEHLEIAPAPGLTVVRGRNGQGKTNLVEAVAYLASLSSFRGVPTEVLIRDGAESARVLGELDTEGRAVTIDATLSRHTGSRAQVNGQRLARVRDLLGVLRVTVFTPDDLELIKGGPAERRRFLDDLLVVLRPSWDAVRTDLERVLRQRSTLLKQCGGRPDGDELATLAVWDARLVDLGTRLGGARAALVAELSPLVSTAYANLAGRAEAVDLYYEAPWMATGLEAALEQHRADDLRRGTTTVGPHRDDVRIDLRHASSRTHASQGEQRSLALSLRLAGHDLVRMRHGSPPVLLLDDVFSELDPIRTDALLRHLPPGQALLTTAEAIPEQAQPDLVVTVDAGVLQ